MTAQFAVIGNPIAHSRSPELHQAFAARMQVSLQYHRLLAELDDFSNSVQTFFADPNAVGMNVTVPFKEQAYQLCKVLTQRAQIAQAVNTLWMQNGVLHGDNTDGLGLVAALQALNMPLQKATVLILGAGGATRGVIAPLFEAGVTRIDIANRTLSRAQQLIQDLQPFLPTAQLQALDLENLAGSYDLVINATSASLTGAAFNLPTALHFSHAYEMAYGKPSAFLAAAQARGAITADGYSMLVGQAIESFAIWHSGLRPNLSDFLTA